MKPDSTASATAVLPHSCWSHKNIQSIITVLWNFPSATLSSIEFRQDVMGWLRHLHLVLTRGSNSTNFDQFFERTFRGVWKNHLVVSESKNCDLRFALSHWKELKCKIFQDIVLHWGKK